ncbi:MAG: Unknown protein [uncultured Sulfurovum sp.]|uniref:Uncharacterized protein n=1 Tax=uncultured Sulfurovum sp. TaxID=269237 RepID=A0A6S6TGZ7_9BACT|nr:MAG: Unknown protein [uncultured Sulfurovum sp.]
MKFYKKLPKNLERENIQLGKYKIFPSYLDRIPSNKWTRAVSNKKDMLLTLLNPIGREWAEGEVYCLFLMPNKSYIIEIDDYVNEAFFRETNDSDLNEVIGIIENALYAFFDKEIKFKE